MVRYARAPTSTNKYRNRSIRCTWNGHTATSSASAHTFFLKFTLFNLLILCLSRVVSHFLDWIHSRFFLIRQTKEKYMEMNSGTGPRWWSNWDICRIAHVEQRYNSRSHLVAVMDVEAHLEPVSGGGRGLAARRRCHLTLILDIDVRYFRMTSLYYTLTELNKLENYLKE